jgi:hypothetical protein
LRRLKEEADARFSAQTELSTVPGQALREFAAFLLSPGVLVQLKSVEKPPRELQEIVEANTPEEVAECILTMPPAKRKELAKALRRVVGKKRAKTVSLSSFRPPVDIVWDQSDLSRVVKAFEQFLREQWDDESYLKVE